MQIGFSEGGALPKERTRSAVLVRVNYFLNSQLLLLDNACDARQFSVTAVAIVCWSRVNLNRLYPLKQTASSRGQRVLPNDRRATSTRVSINVEIST